MTLSLYLSAHFFTSKDQVHSLLLLAGGLFALFRLRKEVNIPDWTCLVSVVIFAISLIVRLGEEQREHSMLTRSEDLNIAIAGVYFYLSLFGTQEEKCVDLTRVVSSFLLSVQIIGSCAAFEDPAEHPYLSGLAMVVYAALSISALLSTHTQRTTPSKVESTPGQRPYLSLLLPSPSS